MIHFSKYNVLAICFLPLLLGMAAQNALANSILERDLIELRLYASPVTRVTCTLRALDEENECTGSEEKQCIGSKTGETKLVQWTPEGGNSLVQTVRVRGGLSWAISCGSEPLQLAGGKTTNTVDSVLSMSSFPTRIYAYRLHAKCKPDDEQLKCRTDVEQLKCRTIQLDPLKSPDETHRINTACLRLTDQLVDPSVQIGVQNGNESPPPAECDDHREIRMTASIRRLSEVAISAGNDRTQIASERSLISFDQVLSELGTAVADVAVEKARSNAEALLQEKIAKVFCKDLTVGRLWQQLKAEDSSTESGLAAWLPPVPSGVYDSHACEQTQTPDKKPCNRTPGSKRRPKIGVCLKKKTTNHSVEDVGPIKDYCEKPLLQNTCETVRTIRVQELAASSDVLRKAVTLDIAQIAIRRFLGATTGNETTDNSEERAMNLIRALLEDALLSDKAINPQRAQSLLFSLASETGTIGNQFSPGDWRVPFLVGLAVVSECLEQGDCTADQIQRLWGQEYAKHHHEIIELQKSLSEKINNKMTSEKWRELLERIWKEKGEFEPTIEAAEKLRNLGVNELNEWLDKIKDHKIDDKEIESITTALKTLEDTLAKLPTSNTLVTWQREVSQWLPIMRDILRPPPGTTHRQTVGQTLALALHVMESAKKRDIQNRTDLSAQDRRKIISTLQQRFATLQSLVDAIVNERWGESVQKGGTVLSAMISDSCEGQGKTCKVALTSRQAEKWFGVLGAFTSYASSYHSKGSGDLSAEELSKYQSEQRKQAMKDLIDAATDRRERARDWVVSLGVDVSTIFWSKVRLKTVAQSENTEPYQKHHKFTMQGLSLPLGLALQYLPGDNPNSGFRGAMKNMWGFHLQLSLLDVGQFVTVSEQELAEPSPATPLFFGLRIGPLIGTPRVNAVVAFDAGYAPGAQYAKETRIDGELRNIESGGWRFGFSIGMYVPFVDFN